MINKKNVKRFCSDSISKIENYAQAIADAKNVWVCHHRAEILPCGSFSPKMLMKFGLYYKRPANELVFMTRSNHISLHNTQRKGKNLSDLCRKKMSSSARKRTSSGMKGKHLSESAKKQLAISMRGRQRYTNGYVERLFNLPPNDNIWKLGRLHKKRGKSLPSFY